MKEETYEKVYIKTEADLPEEDGFYIASCKNYAVLEYHYCNEVKRDWLKDIDWYLKPIEPVSDEDIEKAALRLFPPSRNLGKTVRYGYKIGAIEMRNGKIVKSNEKTEYGKYEFD